MSEREKSLKATRSPVHPFTRSRLSGTVLYVDCSSGASGDMLLAACLDLGWPLWKLRRLLGRLGLKGLCVRTERVHRGGESAARLKVFSGSRRFETPIEMLRPVERLSVSTGVRTESARWIRRLASAEQVIHRRSWHRVRFHQLAGADTLAAICGFLTALRDLGVGRVYASPIPLGAWHRGHAGRWRPSSGPVVRRLLRGCRVVPRPHRFEWTTPTAALLLTGRRPTGAVPPMRVIRIGRAVGRAAVPQGSGVLRLLLGEPA